MAFIYLEDFEGLVVKSAGKMALISPIEVEVEVLVDIAAGFTGGLAARGMCWNLFHIWYLQIT